MDERFFKRIVSKPPVLFPWVALFHLVMLCYGVWNFREFPFPSVYWIPNLWLLAFFVCWLFVCDLRKWAAWGYIALTALSLLLRYLLKYESEVVVYTPTFPIVFILFSFFILFYFRRFN